MQIIGENKIGKTIDLFPRFVKSVVLIFFKKIRFLLKNKYWWKNIKLATKFRETNSFITVINCLCLLFEWIKCLAAYLVFYQHNLELE